MINNVPATGPHTASHARSLATGTGEYYVIAIAETIGGNHDHVIVCSSHHLLRDRVVSALATELAIAQHSNFNDTATAARASSQYSETVTEHLRSRHC